MFQILETILSPIITFIPSHQTFESKVGILGLSLHIVAGSFQGEEYFIAGQNHLIRWPVCLATELGQDQIVLLLLDDVRVLSPEDTGCSSASGPQGSCCTAGGCPPAGRCSTWCRTPRTSSGHWWGTSPCSSRLLQVCTDAQTPPRHSGEKEDQILSWTETYGLHCSILRLREANLEPKTEP